MKITRNKFQFYSKIIILLLVATLVYAFAYSRPPIKFDDAPVAEIIFLALLIMLLVFMLAIMILQLIIFPIGVEIDEEDKSFTIKFLFSKPLRLSPNDLTDFNSIVLKTKSDSYNGILIRVTNGKEFLIGNFSLKEFEPMQLFLEEQNVTFSGPYKLNIVSYFYKYLNIKTNSHSV
ncbi:hypothetical protein ACFOW1_02275 [Parasediminibacterium paludis]|uniref:Uncharacterized protein n=1 Tax=Parasediminibacterium paludis TaxID=908966 RepID=A0ABV8PRB3_9BACT